MQCSGFGWQPCMNRLRNNVKRNARKNASTQWDTGLRNSSKEHVERTESEIPTPASRPARPSRVLDVAASREGRTLLTLREATESVLLPRLPHSNFKFSLSSSSLRVVVPYV